MSEENPKVDVMEKQEGQEKSDVKIDTDNNEEVEEVEEVPVLDLSNHFLKPDHFEDIHILDNVFEKLDGAPNFRQIPGFPIYGTSQPTEHGMTELINKIKTGTENEKIIWINMRSEPVVFINGNPYAARHPDALHENLLISLNDDEVKSVGIHLTKVIGKRMKASKDNTIEVHVDKSFNENPMDRTDVEESLVVESVKDLETVYNSCRDTCNVNLQVFRIPLLEDKNPSEHDFDAIINALKNERASTPCIFSCQMGKGRTTQGMVAAMLIKEIQITTELRNMEAMNLIKSDTLKDLLFKKFEEVQSVNQEETDQLTKGEFEVVKELIAAYPEARKAKEKIDIIIDKCGLPPRGVGIQNLRECIMETKWKFDVSPEENQGVYKIMIIDFIERYFYLICYCMYSMEFGSSGYLTSFHDWMESKKELRTMASEGKDKLEWSRTVDADKLEQLKEMIASPDYKDNITKLIRKIYDFAFHTYADLPRGPIKKNSMKKLTFTTLMEILPPEMAENINKKIGEHPDIRPDFVSIIGMVSYY